jgi:hypothetical protein
MKSNLIFSTKRVVLLVAAATFTFVPAAAQAQTSVVKPDVSITTPDGGTTKASSVRMNNGGGGYGSCFLRVENHTPWYIRFYTDGENRGVVAPFSESTGSVGCGYVTFSGVARFDDGTVRTWAPTTYYVPGSFTFHLWR